MRTLLALLALVVAAQAKVGFFRHALYDEVSESREMTGEKPLILTGMDPAQARLAAVVKGAGLDVLSATYSGFFTTQHDTQNNMFFLYFEAISPVTTQEEAEVLIWLQGGPGGSSLFGAFSEMGPYTLEKNGNTYEAVKRPVTWNDKYAMLFIDNPVGAGFSFTASDAGFCTNTKQCTSANLYSLLQQWYAVFPEKRMAPLYMTGESFGGKYIPDAGAFIHFENQKVLAGKSNNTLIPLAGVAIGDGWVDPVNMIGAYPDMMFGQGMISYQQREVVRKIVDKSIKLMREDKMLDAFNVWDEFLNGDVFPYQNLFHNMTGSNDYDNLANTNAPDSMSFYPAFMNQADVRRTLHVGDAPFPFDPSACEHHLLADFMVSARSSLEVLADHYKVLVYSGQYDVIIGSALTESFLPFMEWKGQKELNEAQRMVWRIKDTDAEVAGYVRQANEGKFTYAIIRGAGHIAPFDQPERSRDMIERFIKNHPYKNLPNPAKK